MSPATAIPQYLSRRSNPTMANTIPQVAQKIGTGGSIMNRVSMSLVRRTQMDSKKTKTALTKEIVPKIGVLHGRVQHVLHLQLSK